jgi:hypothetical protein
MEFYDSHIHFLFKCPRSDIKLIFDYLAGIGLRGLDAFVIAEYPCDSAANCYTDSSSLTPFIREAPRPYRQFLANSIHLGRKIPLS